MIYKLPKHYLSILDVFQTLEAKNLVETILIKSLKQQYNLLELMMPKFEEASNSENDNINFDTKDDFKIYTLLSKYDNIILKNIIDYKINSGKGLLTFNHAIDRSSTPTPVEFYENNKLVMELVTKIENSNFKYLINNFTVIFNILKTINEKIVHKFPDLINFLNQREPKIISFQEIENEFGYLSFEERINAIVEKHKIVLIYGLHSKLNSKSTYKTEHNFYNDINLSASLFVYNKYYRFAYQVLELGFRKNRNSDNKLSLKTNDPTLNPLIKMDSKNITSIFVKIDLFKLSLFLLEKANISEIQKID